MLSVHDTRSSYLRPELRELRQRLEALPREWREEFLPLCARLTAWSRQQNRLVQMAQEAVDQLQLDIKCLYFDLDATRRERDALRGQLERE